ncbi:Hypothetical protein A7982_10108 [Minicystis rosea]|nr:Hypothetical protein A7982_10108 [Minicystis rosea]
MIRAASDRTTACFEGRARWSSVRPAIAGASMETARHGRRLPFPSARCLATRRA